MVLICRIHCPSTSLLKGCDAVYLCPKSCIPSYKRLLKEIQCPLLPGQGITWILQRRLFKGVLRTSDRDKTPRAQNCYCTKAFWHPRTYSSAYLTQHRSERSGIHREFVPIYFILIFFSVACSNFLFSRNKLVCAIYLFITKHIQFSSCRLLTIIDLSNYLWDFLMILSIIYIYICTYCACYLWSSLNNRRCEKAALKKSQCIKVWEWQGKKPKKNLERTCTQTYPLLTNNRSGNKESWLH